MGPRVVVALVVVAIAAVLWLVAAPGGGDGPLREAQDLVADEANFESGRAATETMLEAGALLLRAADRCVEDRGETPYCLVFRSAAAWSNVAAVEAAECRAPGRFELKRSARRYYESLGALRPSRLDPPGPPPVPRCRAAGAATPAPSTGAG